MGRKKRISDSSGTNLGIQANVINAGAVAVGNRATAIVNQEVQPHADELMKIFAQLRQKAAELPDEESKQDATTAIASLEQEVQKGDDAREKVVGKWLNFLFETAPDIWEIAVNTFINPVKGVSLVFQKVAERARVEHNRGTAQTAKKL